MDEDPRASGILLHNVIRASFVASSVEVVGNGVHRPIGHRSDLVGVGNHESLRNVARHATRIAVHGILFQRVRDRMPLLGCRQV